MAGSENQVSIDEEAWKLVLPDQWNLSGEHEKAIREGLEIFAHDINSIENERPEKILHYPLLLHEKENNERMCRDGRY